MHRSSRRGWVARAPGGVDEAPRYRRPPSPARTSSARPWTGASPRWPSPRSGRWPRSRSTSSPTRPSSGGWARSRWPGWHWRPRSCCSSPSLCSFLAYGTTPRVARARGANDPRSAAAVGVQSLWLGVLLGLPLAAALVLFARPVVQLLGGEGAALDAAVIYLRISAIGVPFVLLGAGRRRRLPRCRRPPHAAGHRVHGQRRQPAPRDRRRLRARPGHRRIGLEHGRRPDRGRGRLPAAHAPPPGRRAVPPT